MKKFTLLLMLAALPVFAAKPIIGADPVLKPTPPPTAPAPADPSLLEPEAPDKAIARFFAYLQRREVDQAYDQLTRGTVIAEHAEDVKMLKSKTMEVIKVYGPIQGYEPVAVKKVGDHVLRQTVVSLGRDLPLRWRFYFYRAGESWRLIDMRVDDKLSAIFDELEEVPKPDAP